MDVTTVTNFFENELNNTFITLICKSKKASQVKNCKPLNLCNVDYKTISNLSKQAQVHSPKYHFSLAIRFCFWQTNVGALNQGRDTMEAEIESAIVDLFQSQHQFAHLSTIIIKRRNSIIFFFKRLKWCMDFKQTKNLRQLCVSLPSSLFPINVFSLRGWKN